MHTVTYNKYTSEQLEIRSGLNSKLIGEKIEAESRLRAMGPAGVELLLEFLADEASIRKTRKRWAALILGMGLGFASLIAIYLIASENFAALPGLCGFAGFLGVAGMAAPTPRYYRIVNVLTQTDDVRSIGALCDTLSVQDTRTRAAAIRALYRILPKLLPENADLLNTMQKEALHKLMANCDFGRESNLILVIMDALTRIEDVSALPTILAITKQKPLNDGQRNIINAALASVMVLQDIQNRANSPQELLRASNEITPVKQLLRPVNEAVDHHADELLRAGQQ